MIIKLERMRKKVLGAAAVMILIAVGCGERSEKKAAEALGPEETVEAFCRAVAGGEFEAAAALCDTAAIQDYIGRYAQAWKMQAKKDSSATAIAAATLSEAEFVFDKTIRDGDTRTVSYTISSGEKMTKRKTATVKKVEGVWKVEKITDSL